MFTFILVRSCLHLLKLYILYLTYLLKFLLLIPIFMIHYKICPFQCLKTIIGSKGKFLSTLTKENLIVQLIHRNSDQKVVEDSNYRYNKGKRITIAVCW